MKRKGLRFQTKLFFAFFAATALVSFAVIQLTSGRVRHTYQRQFKEKFDRQVEFIVEAREKRASEQFALGEKLAGDDFVIQTLKNGKTASKEAKTAFLKRLQTETLRQTSKTHGSGGQRPGGKGLGSGGGPERGGPPRPVNRFVGLLNLEGTITELNSLPKPRNKPPGENPNSSKKDRSGKRSILRYLENFAQQDVQHITFHPLPNSMVLDVIVTPVKDPDENNQIIGALLISPPLLGSTATHAERFIDRYYQEIGGSHFENAILVNGEIYPSQNHGGDQRPEKESDAPIFRDLKEAITAKISTLPPGAAEGNFESSLHGQPHYIHFCALNPDSPLSIAYQVSAFPLAELHRDIRDLRIKGSAIGLVGTLLGLIASLIFARNLSVPIRDLSAGTRRISQGNLETEIPIRSLDELGELAASFNRMTAELRQKEIYRQLLDKVSDASVAQAMIEGTLNPELGGELKEVTVLFCDIRGFTNLTETMRPEDVIEMLNQHMTALTNVVREHFGVVDKFVGDEIMAVFGGLKSYGNDAANAAHCALKMMEERERLNQEKGTKIQIGIGIASGEIVAGCMGSADRLNYTVLGARVNLGARLCGRAGPGEIIIDDQTHAKIQHLNPLTEPIEGLRLKGFSADVPASKLSRLTPATSERVLS